MIITEHYEFKRKENYLQKLGRIFVQCTQTLLYVLTSNRISFKQNKFCYFQYKFQSNQFLGTDFIIEYWHPLNCLEYMALDHI